MLKTIPLNFEIPEGFERFYLFEEAETGFQVVLIFDRKGVGVGWRGKASKVGESRSLDWQAEVMEQVRKEVGDVR